MFTGLVQGVGRLERMRAGAEGGTLEVRCAGLPGGAWEAGESIAVDGVCLTLTGWRGEVLAFDVLGETVARTALAGKRAGARVNLERALRSGAAVGGHFVSGHVDGTATVRRLEASGRDVILHLRADGEAGWAANLLEKGSVAVDGVSLTLTGTARDDFCVNLIPHTREATTLGSLRPGDRVNIETDMLAKAARAAVAGSSEKKREGGGVTMEMLRRAGF